MIMMVYVTAHESAFSRPGDGVKDTCLFGFAPKIDARYVTDYGILFGC